MSLLNQLFNRGVFGAKCKTCLGLSISRIKLLQNKRDLQTKHMRKEIAQFLQAGQEAIAQIRVEYVIREQNMWASYEILELFCEFILARVPVIENQRECPTELREAIASIIFSAPRCSDVPDLLHLKNLFATKYGKEFVAAVSELRPDSGVNRTIIEKLSVSTPSGDLKLKVLKEIAREYKLDWDSSNAEAELTKHHEDLLGGSKHISINNQAGEAIQTTTRQSFFKPSIPGIKQEHQKFHQGGKNEEIRTPIIHSNENSISGVKREIVSQPSEDVLDRARSAIAAAERASSAARIAANLVTNFKFESTVTKSTIEAMRSS